MTRPEELAPPEIFYNRTEAKKYAVSSRMKEIQAKMSDRAIEMLCLKQDRHAVILDIGCGSGMSGDVLAELGYTWIGLDISRDMLEVAVDEAAEGELIENDMGQGFAFRPGTFDGCISISAIQWLCNADKAGVDPYKRLCCFFQSLYNCLKTGSRAVLQFYPDTPKQLEMITSASMRSGFGGGLVVDFPNSTRAKKFYLVLYAGFTVDQQQLPRALTENDGAHNTEEIRVERKNVRKDNDGKNKKPIRGSKDWILKKKERQRMQGKKTANDSKFSGRKRKRF